MIITLSFGFRSLPEHHRVIFYNKKKYEAAKAKAIKQQPFSYYTINNETRKRLGKNCEALAIHERQAWNTTDRTIEREEEDSSSWKKEKKRERIKYTRILFAKKCVRSMCVQIQFVSSFAVVLVCVFVWVRCGTLCFFFRWKFVYVYYILGHIESWWLYAASSLLRYLHFTRIWIFLR